MCGRALGEIDCEVLRATRALRRALGEIDCEVLPQGGGLSRAALGGEEIGRGRFFRGLVFGFTGPGLVHRKTEKPKPANGYKESDTHAADTCYDVPRASPTPVFDTLPP